MMPTKSLAKNLTLDLLPDILVVCKLPAGSKTPDWAQSGQLYVIVRTQDELSVVCQQQLIPPEVEAERGWRALKVNGQMDFTLKGILAALALPLAEAGVSIFAISTYDTDFILVRQDDLLVALSALRKAGHTINELLE
jgi:hypothetical protein